MHRTLLVALGTFILLIGCAGFAAAQFPKIKIPKIEKPKPTPTPEAQPIPSEAPSQPTQPAQPSQPEQRSNSGAQQSGGAVAVRPERPMTPLFLADTLKVDVELWDYFWKIPNDNHNTSWAPRINFDVFYGGAAKLRYKADYFMPDGSLWYSEALEYIGNNESTGIQPVQSPSGSDRDKKAIITGGLFGIKITNIRDNTTVFQGKFKVVRYRPSDADARYKNEVDYYVDYDWKLPIGYADIEYQGANAGYSQPIIRMWFKGNLNRDNLEARLFHEGKQIATTDEGGLVDTGESYAAAKRGNDQSLYWREFKFSWPRRVYFLMTQGYGKPYRTAFYINQMPGEYVVKVYFNGEQVRETKFTIENGNYGDNGIAKQSNLTTNKAILPVKVMGTLDKWNAANAKAMGFYGNPLVGVQ